VACRIIDAYSVKPIDASTLQEAAKATKGRLVVVEDHWPEGGLGEAVLGALAESGVAGTTVTRLAVKEMPGSGTPEEMLRVAGIDAKAIVAAVKGLIHSEAGGIGLA
jgi:transketolase